VTAAVLAAVRCSGASPPRRKSRGSRVGRRGGAPPLPPPPVRRPSAAASATKATRACRWRRLWRLRRLRPSICATRRCLPTLPRASACSPAAAAALRSCVTSRRCGRSRACFWCSSRRRPAGASAGAAADTGDALPPDRGGGNGDGDGDGGGCGGGAAATAGDCAQLTALRATLRGAEVSTLAGFTDAVPSVGAAVVVTTLAT